MRTMSEMSAYMPDVSLLDTLEELDRTFSPYADLRAQRTAAWADAHPHLQQPKAQLRRRPELRRK